MQGQEDECCGIHALIDEVIALARAWVATKRAGLGAAPEPAPDKSRRQPTGPGHLRPGAAQAPAPAVQPTHGTARRTGGEHEEPDAGYDEGHEGDTGEAAGHSQATRPAPKQPAAPKPHGRR